MKKTIHNLISFACVYLQAQTSFADQFHYNNVLVGDRAIGLGGAYGAIADDASGVFYNPAGLGFALSNDVSGSANALYNRKIVYKKTIGSSDFEEKSSGPVPSFLGGLQKLDNMVKGLVFAFGMYTPDSELKDQDDLIPSTTLTTPSPCIKKDANGNPVDAAGAVTSDPNAYQYGAARPAVVLERFHRTSNQRGSTFFGGAALGYRVTAATSIGFGMNYMTVDELVQEYQDVRMIQSKCLASGSYINVVSQNAQNIRQYLKAIGLQPVFGFQTALLDRLSLGITMKFGAFISQSFDQSAEVRATTLTEDDQKAVDAAGGNAVASTSSVSVGQFYSVTKDKNPLGKSLPSEYRLGLAYFASTRLLLAYDAIMFGKTKAGFIENSGELYQRGSILNHALGLEYYLTAAIPLRLGFFTNSDTRPKVKTGESGQADHVDYKGLSMFLAWVQPNSQVGAGGVIQTGTGEAQKIAGSTDIQKVEASSFTFAFSASHSF